MLEIEGVYTAYDKADVLQGVSLEVQDGSITCLLGSNGSGKTTLVRSILGLTPPRAGRIVFNGTDITRMPTHKIIAAGIACIPEGRKVFPKLTVEENLRVGAYQETSDKAVAGAHGRNPADFSAARRASHAACRHDVRRRAGDGVDWTRPDVRAQAASDRRAVTRPVAAVGKGEFQHHPQINERGITVLLVEQNVHQTLAISHYGFVLSKGRVAASGSPTELAARHEVRDAYFG